MEVPLQLPMSMEIILNYLELSLFLQSQIVIQKKNSQMNYHYNCTHLSVTRVSIKNK